MPSDQIKINKLDPTVNLYRALPQTFIVNGQNAYENQFPWHVSILRPDNNDETLFHVAGGTILSPEWILTAGHVAKPLKHYNIRFGSLNLWSGGDLQTSNQSIVHEDYNETTLANNIALIRIPRPVNLEKGSNLKAIRLPCPGDWKTLVGQRARTAGHGLGTDGKISSQLNFVDLQLIDNISCRGTFGNRVNENIVCGIGWESRFQNTCGGDSGGALLVRVKGHWVQAGVTAFGALRACDRGFPSAFTRVLNFADWIERETGLNLREHCSDGAIPTDSPFPI